MIEMTKQKKLDITQIIRHIIQGIAFILFPGMFYLIYLAFKSIYMSLITGSFSWDYNLSDVGLLLAVIPVTILWGRFFCGYLCSFGAMGELVYFIASKMRKKNPVIPKKADKVLKYVKYVILVLLIVFVWTLGFSIDPSNNPLNVFGMVIRPVDLASFKVLLSVGGVLLLLIIIGSAFIERMFCRYLCPMGAVFSIISKLRLNKIKRKGSSCAGCGVCERKCPMGVELSKVENGAVSSGECIDCMRCLKACPTKALSADKNPAANGAAAAIVITGLYYAGNVLSDKVVDYVSEKRDDETTVTSITESEETEVTTTETTIVQTSETTEATEVTETTEATTTETTEDPNRGPYVDGVYEGSGSGYRGTTEVTVTVENGYITDIELVSKKDDDKFFNRAWDKIIDSILSSQSTDVSTVSGATFSSCGIIEAVSDALDIPYDG